MLIPCPADEESAKLRLVALPRVEDARKSGLGGGHGVSGV
jgi:hypothetical protein